jgi:hypothetical protein
MIPCSICGKEVTCDDQYMIGHNLGKDGCVIHTVTHMTCLVGPTWAEDVKTAAPANEEQDNGER